jgi:hypothetical protein
MDFYAVLDQAVDLLRQRGRVTYRALKIQFKLDDDQLEALRDELLYAHPQVVDDAGLDLLWTGAPAAAPSPAAAPATGQDLAPLAYTLQHLAEKILTSRAALEGERKQVTVLFADLKRSMELLAERLGDDLRLGRIAAYLCNSFSAKDEHDHAIAAGQRAHALATARGASDV